MPFIPTRLRLNEATISASDDDRPGINSLKLIKSEKKILFIFHFNRTLQVIHQIQLVHQLH
jgi:hypothetical protein